MPYCKKHILVHNQNVTIDVCFVGSPFNQFCCMISQLINADVFRSHSWVFMTVEYIGLPHHGDANAALIG